MNDNLYPDSLLKLIKTISRLPGIGKRTAERLALSLHSWSEDDLKFFGEQLISLKENVKSCSTCGNFSDEEECKICLDYNRDPAIICVVENAAQIAVIEKSRSFNGVYHVLAGRLSPMNGIGPDKLNLNSFKTRCMEASEVILATSPDFEGEATASFLTQELNGIEINISRIAQGIPVGADLSFADSASMAMAINSRRTL
ncbi:MAG: recombination mediator RecR [Lentisphaeraceae bacterium]|nr:recombination mediator RecR [Lentisphaeraceae bacterium]